MKAPPLFCPNAGFTLLESLLALVILSLGLLALARLQISGLQGNAWSRDMTTAVAIAEEKTEQLRNTPFTNIQAESATQVTVSNRNFTKAVTVTDDAPDGLTGTTKTVRVIVSWQDSKRKTHTVQIATIIAQPLAAGG
jgi:type II secretion system protein I